MPFFLPPPQDVAYLAQQVQVGDVVFIRVPAKPFREVADATLSWTNHVGVVVDQVGAEPVVAESTFPLSRFTTFSKFVARSEDHRVAVARLNEPLSGAQRAALYEAASQRKGVFYDTGFNLRSSRQFCSKYVREVVAQATGQELGEVENFSTLLSHNPNINLRFWRAWYFGRIPWQRQTVSPASLLQSPKLHPIFDGVIQAA